MAYESDHKLLSSLVEREQHELQLSVTTPGMLVLTSISKGPHMKKLLTLIATLALLLGIASPASPVSTDRLAGPDRYQTAVEVSKSTWNPANTKYIYIARGDVLYDALVAGVLTDGPILLTGKGSLNKHTKAEINRLGNKRIVVIGGTGSISDAAALEASGGKPFIRLGGKDRHETSVKVSKFQFRSSAKVYVTESIAGGNVSADAVVGGTLIDGPILLVNGRVGPSQAVLNEISRLGASEIVQIGGNPLKMDVTREVSGINRYGTAIQVSYETFGATMGLEKVYLSNALVFADAVAAGSLTDGPILLTRADRLHVDTCMYLAHYNPKQIVALGGDGAVSDYVLERAKGYSDGSTQYPADPDPGPVPAPVTPAPTKPEDCGIMPVAPEPGESEADFKKRFDVWNDCNTRYVANNPAIASASDCEESPGTDLVIYRASRGSTVETARDHATNTLKCKNFRDA